MRGHRGFVLLEVMISIVIVSFLSLGLLTTIMQINRLLQHVTNMTSIYTRAAIIKRQMERDISGAFIPAQVEMLPTSTVKQEESKTKPLGNIFVVDSKGDKGRLEMLTCITNNPLEIFVGIKDVSLKPLIARVVYRLVPDSRKKNSYALMRQEGTASLRFDEYTPDAGGKLRAFHVIDGIQSCFVQCIALEKKVDKETKKTTILYKRSASWKDVQEKKDTVPAGQKERTARKKTVHRLPHFIEVTLSLWDTTFKESRQVVFTIPILGQGDIQEEQQTDSEENKGDTPVTDSPVVTQHQGTANGARNTDHETILLAVDVIDSTPLEASEA